MKKRVVITGMGVISPNGIGVKDFNKSLQLGKSGIKFYPELEELNFRCQVGGIPPLSKSTIEKFKKKYHKEELISTGVIYGCMAAIEAWEDAGLKVPTVQNGDPDWESGCIFGTGSNGAEASELGIDTLTPKKGVKLDTMIPMQALASCVSAYIGGILGLGNQVTTNSSACSTGTEGILEAYYRIQNGLAERFLVGSSESSSFNVWSPFDAMFATAQDHNHHPKKASCPLNAAATGFVPGAGAGALVVESLASAKKRGAKIYAEILGGSINSGGHRGKGSMTIGNIEGMIKCIKDAFKNTKTKLDDLDLISGHLTSTIGDVYEIASWATALQRRKKPFPYINALKSMIGHSLSASGSIELVGTVLQLCNNYVHPSLNAFPLHEEIEPYLPAEAVPVKTIENIDLNIVAKISLGFGDVNACVFLKKYKEE